MAEDQANVSDPDPSQRRGSSGVIAAIVLVALVVVIAIFMYTTDRREDREAAALTGAVNQVTQAGDRMGDAVGNAARKLEKR